MFTDRNKIHAHAHTDTSSMVKTTLRDWVPSVARFKNETEDATNYSLDLKGRFRGKGYFWSPEFYFDRKLMTAETEEKNISLNSVKVIAKTFHSFVAIEAKLPNGSC